MNSWFICLSLLGVAAALLVVGLSVRRDEVGGWFAVVGVALAMIAIVALLVMGARTVSHEYKVRQCRGYSEASDQDTKFVDYNYWQWDCLVWADGFGWIPKDQLRNDQP